MPNKSCAYLLNAKPSNLVFLKVYNTEFEDIIITFLYKRICQRVCIFVIREKSSQQIWEKAKTMRNRKMQKI